MSVETWAPDEYLKEFSGKQWLESVNFFESDFVNARDIMLEIQQRIKRESLLGEGGIAKVFDLGNGYCLKLMPNRENSPQRDLYKLGNTTQQEAKFLRELNDFEYQGVRTPKVTAYYVGRKGTAIIMETMDATNLQQALNGKEKFPENFNYEDFYGRLSEYVDQLHTKKGIAHGDLFARNVMIDRQTGRPVVIDFGRARHIDPKNVDRDPSAQEDLKLLESDIYEKLEKHFS